MNSQMAYGKQNTDYAFKTDCWFNHKELGILLNSFEKIGHIELEKYALWSLAPASELDDIYKEITSDVKIWHLKLNDTCCLVKSF